MSATHPHIQEAFAPLTGEHRMEVVADKDGVRYINNSRATNLNAAWYALELMPPGRRVHWLVGGGGYDGDHGDADAWRALLPVAREKVKAIYDVSVPLNLPMKVAFAGHFEMPGTLYLSLAHATWAARAAAEPGDIVLLNPGRASFRDHTNHEARGHAFKAAVAAI